MVLRQSLYQFFDPEALFASIGALTHSREKVFFFLAVVAGEGLTEKGPGLFGNLSGLFSRAQQGRQISYPRQLGKDAKVAIGKM
jgi:hypothetical protein